MPPKRKSNYGKRKKDKKCLPGTVSLRMCISPGIGQKPRMIKVPYIGTFNELKYDAGNYGGYKGASDISGDTDLTELFVRSWYLKLRKAKALKVVFIDFMQQCVRASYYGHLPNWFRKRIRYKSSDNTVKEYFLKARRILGAYLLYQFDTGGRAQGNLLTNKSFRNMMTVVMDHKYGRMPPQQQMSKILSRLQFKPYEALLAEVKSYDQRLKSIFDIIREIDHSHWTDGPNNRKHSHRNSIVKMANGDEQAGSKGICPNLFHRFKVLVRLVMDHPEGYAQIAIGDKSFQTVIIQRDARNVNKEIPQANPVTNNNDDNNEGVGNQSGSFLGKKRHEVDSEQDYTNDAKLKLLKNLKFKPPLPPKKPPRGSIQNNIPPVSGVYSLRPKPDTSNITSVVDEMNIETNYDSAMDQMKTINDQHAKDPEGAKDTYNNLHPDVKIYVIPPGGSAFGRRRRRRVSFGRSPNLAQMTGYVRPYTSSSMERYTGMTPSMYKRHINSRTGNPMGQRGPGLARANNYYGSSALGTRLNPPNAFGRRARKKVGTKRKKCARGRKKCKQNEFGKFFF